MTRFRLISLVLALLVLSLPVSAARGASRIVTLAPVISEWVAEILGPDYSREKIVGVSEYSSYPAYLKSKPSIGPYPQPNLEAILALKPDLVIGSEEYSRPDQVERMRKLGLPLKVLPKEKFSGMEEWIGALGDLLGDQKGTRRAQERWRRLKRGIRRGKGPYRKAFIEIQHEPLITVGAGSFLAEALRETGFETVFSDLADGYPKVSVESVAQRNPDWIFILGHDSKGSDGFQRSKERWSRMSRLSAVKERRIHLLPGDDFARCSLRLLIALKRLNSLHAD
jgi:ABC-type Fe3+-hydroxamate transport system substrate-binding protein